MLIPGTQLSLVVLPQAEAETRSPAGDEAMFSIMGTGEHWPAPEFVPGAYPLGMRRVRLDDIGHELPPEQVQALKAAFEDLRAMGDDLVAMGRPATMLIHCLAGRSRSAAFAVGLLGHLVPPEGIPQTVESLARDFQALARPFQPNPLFLETFEGSLGLQRDALAAPCRAASEAYRTWEIYWARKAIEG